MKNPLLMEIGFLKFFTNSVSINYIAIDIDIEPLYVDFSIHTSRVFNIVDVFRRLRSNSLNRMKAEVEKHICF